MIAATFIRKNARQVFIGFGWLVLAYPILTVLFLNNYLVLGSMNFILGMAAVILGSQMINRGVYSSRYGWVAFVMICLCWLMPVKTLLYFTICLSAIFFVERCIGKLNPLVPLSMFFMSPVFQYLVSSFSFPIRLTLTQTAGRIFNLIGIETIVTGNVIVMGANEYSVDSACMGLQMMEASLLLGVLLLLLFQKQYNKKLHLGYTLLFFIMVVLLNIICNLLRIIILVQFNIPAETIGHELVGILSLILYVFVPAIWLARRMVRKFNPFEIKNVQSVSGYGRLIPHLIFLAGVLILGFRVNKADTHATTPLVKMSTLNGYSLSEYSPGILKLQNERSLVYLKFTRGFFDTDHSPVLCWTGSGYLFQKVEEKTIGGNSVYTGILEKGTDRLYTAWWFDNGSSQTIDPIAWRWDNMKGANNYSVVNVTCNDPGILSEEIKHLIESKALKPLLVHSVNKSENETD